MPLKLFTTQMRAQLRNTAEWKSVIKRVVLIRLYSYNNMSHVIKKGQGNVHPAAVTEG